MTNDEAFRLAQAAIYHSQPGEFPDAQIMMTPSDLVRFAAMCSTTDKLQRLLARCKHSVSIEVNEHRDMYDSAEKTLDDLACLECPPRITDEVRAQIIATDTIVDMHVYPDTAIGSYHIVHHDIDAALDIALACVGIKP